MTTPAPCPDCGLSEADRTAAPTSAGLCWRSARVLPAGMPREAAVIACLLRTRGEQQVKLMAAEATHNALRGALQQLADMWVRAASKATLSGGCSISDIAQARAVGETYERCADALGNALKVAPVTPEEALIAAACDAQAAFGLDELEDYAAGTGLHREPDSTGGR